MAVQETFETTIGSTPVGILVHDNGMVAMFAKDAPAVSATADAVGPMRVVNVDAAGFCFTHDATVRAFERAGFTVEG